MTPHGLQFVINRLNQAADLPALRTAWKGLGLEYKLNEKVQAVKDKRKEALGG